MLQQLLSDHALRCGERSDLLLTSESPRRVECGYPVAFFAPGTAESLGLPNIGRILALMNRDEPLLIDVGLRPRRKWRLWLIIAAIILLLILLRSISIYVSALWFGSLGYEAVYWYIFKAKTILFFGFALLTILILRACLWLIERAFGSSTWGARTVLINNQPINFSPSRFARPAGWILSVICGLLFGLSMKDSWQKFALFFHQAAAPTPDPIFNKPLSFYLFSLPVYDLLSSWLIVLAVIVLVIVLVYAVASTSELGTAFVNLARGTPIAAISCAAAALFVALAWSIYLSRFPYLWNGHQTFSGVTYAEANYILPALLFVAVAFVIAGVTAVVNAFAVKSLRLLLIAGAAPIAIYIVGGVLVPAYVTSFIVKPNERGRESP